MTHMRSQLGDSLAALGRLGAAAEQYRQALAATPYAAADQEKLRGVLARLGRWDDVLAAWRAHQAARVWPPERAWAGYAECCLFLGRVDEYRRACREQLDRFGTSTDPVVCEGIGRAALLHPSVPGPDVERATALIDRALDAERAKRTWRHPYFMFAKGLAEHRAGRADAAIAILEGDAAGVLGPAPQLVVTLARASLGQEQAARRVLAEAVLAFDWSPDAADTREAWIYHVLRREAEAKVLPDLPAFLEGRHEPRDNAERIALTAACRFERRHAMGARLWADAFATDPALAARGREHAVKAAVLAGGGDDAGAPALSDADRARWRRQALAWVREEFAVLTANGQPSNPDAAAVARATLTNWTSAAALAGVRDPAALGSLPDAERAEWTAVWAAIGAALRPAPAR